MVELTSLQEKVLDFFSERPFSYEKVLKFINQIKKNLKFKKIEKKKIFDRYEFFLENKDKLRIEFVYFEHKIILKHIFVF